MQPPGEFAFSALRADAMVYQELTERRGRMNPETARRTRAQRSRVENGTLQM